MDLYKNIKKLRLINGWSQEELAAKAGYADKGMISRIESGKINLRTSQIITFANIFKVTPGILFGTTENSFVLSSDEEEIIKSFRLADGSTQEAIKKILDIDSTKKRRKII